MWQPRRGPPGFSGPSHSERVAFVAALAFLLPAFPFFLAISDPRPTSSEYAPDERTRDDARAIQNWVVCHGGMAVHGAGAYPASLTHVGWHRAQEAE